MAGSEEDTAGGLVLANDMTGGWRAHDPVLTKQQFLDAICSPNLDDELHNLRIPKAAIAADDEKAAIYALGYREEDAGDKSLTVMRLLEDLDLLSKTRAMKWISFMARVSTESKVLFTYVPGFWSWNGVRDTSLTLMVTNGCNE